MNETGYTPSPWQQAYHSLTTHEALGAGSAGPGKSLCLLMDPLQQIVTEHERCADKGHRYHQKWGSSQGWAMHMRREFPMLEHTIARAHRLFPQIDPGVKWNAQRYMFQFSSGYRFQFGHCRDITDAFNYQSAEFCIARGTLVAMADGTLRPIEAILPGQLVETLEGPRPVVATWATGVKPCVEVVVRDHGEIVGRQRHSTTHPVLAGPTGESPSSPSQDSPRTVGRARPHGWTWQDHESLLGGAPESPPRRASAVDARTETVGFGDSRLELRRLPASSFPVVLHERLALQAAERQRTPSGCRVSGRSPSPSAGQPPAHVLLVPESIADLGRAAEVARLGRADGSSCPVCGAESAPLGQETPIGSPGRCWFCSDPRDARLRGALAAFRGWLLRPADAGTHDPSTSALDGQARTQPDIPCKGASYPHFYSGLARPRSEAVRTGTAEARFCGFEETFDLTVAGANHFITESGLVNAQTHLAFDELVQFDKEQYDQICTRVRSSDPVLRTMLKIRSMSNPVMRHEGSFTAAVRDPFWVRDHFVKPHRDGGKVLQKKIIRADGTPEYRTRIYLRATLYDNPDPQFVRDYEAQLLDKPAHIRQALLYGNWFVTPGSFFGDDWNEAIHVCPPFRIPDDWARFRSMDWGYKQPGCVHWWAMDDDGTLYCEREYTFQLRDVTEVGRRIREIEQAAGLYAHGRSLITGPADTQLWEERGDRAITKAAEMQKLGITWTPADKQGRARTAQLLLSRLKDHGNYTKAPGIVAFETCRMIRDTLPGIMADPHDPECPEDGGPDHWLDSWRYACAYASHGRKGLGTVKRPERSDEDDDEPAAVTGNPYAYGAN